MPQSVEDIELQRTIGKLMDTFDGLLAERTQVRQRLDELERQLAGLQQSIQGLVLYAKAKEVTLDIHGLAAVVVDQFTKSEFADTSSTLTNSCRLVLESNGGWMPAVAVREALHARAFDFSKYTSN